MSNLELQEEEREVLLSIYDGDPAFNQLSPITYQYKFGDDGDPKSFLLEISWGETYPSEKPLINMDTFYNKHIVSVVKEKVISAIIKEAEMWLGSAMTYTVFEFVKENLNDLVSDQPEQLTKDEKIEELSEVQQEETFNKRDIKKERLSKAQKRKQWDRIDSKGERPRGWDWVDVVKHLSQTGSKHSSEPQTSTS
ncbi:hypothetical protein AAG570_000604 [Ranatra chinensis]|uniref:RWD domain-containing protein n=1 Tax=Ranatra chinensis TaxID=642074 RepID=A0ABD0YZK4_9HEMI